MKTSEGSRGAPDFLLMILTLALVGFGLVMVFSASSSMAGASEKFGNDALFFTKRQFMFAGLGTFLMLVIMNVPYVKFKKLFLPLMLLTIALLIMVPFFSAINGASSWIRFAGSAFSPRSWPSSP